MLTIENVKSTFLDLIKDTPIGKKLVEDRHAANQAQRVVEVRAVAALQARLERELPALQAAEAEALAAVVKAQRDVALAEGRWQEKNHARRGLVASIEGEITRHQGVLLQSADGSIQSFLEGLDLLEQQTRSAFAVVDVFRETYAGQHFEGQRTNTEQIRAHLEDIRAARAAAEALKLAIGDNLPADFDRISGSIRPPESLKITAA